MSWCPARNMNPSSSLAASLQIWMTQWKKKNNISNWSEEDHEGETLWKGNPQPVNKLTLKYQMLSCWLQDSTTIISQSSHLSNTRVSCFTASTSLHLYQTWILWLDHCRWQLGSNIMLASLGYPCCKLAFINNTLRAVGAYHPSATLGAQQGMGVRGVARRQFVLAMVSEWVFPFVPSLYFFDLSIFHTPPVCLLPSWKKTGFTAQLRISTLQDLKNLQKHLDPGKGVSLYIRHVNFIYCYECEICAH